MVARKFNVRKSTFIIFLYLIQALNSHAQITFTDTLKSIFEKQNSLLIQEKVYLHTDKQFYITGETIWFKLYCVDASVHHLMDVSKIAYVELLSTDQKPTLQVKVELDNGIGDGYLELPASMVSGNFRLRAYTSWMKNFSPEFYFEKTLSIINPSRNPTKAVEGKGQPSIQFFPEGGNLVYGIESRIGFEAKDSKGVGLAARCMVINQANDTVARFQPLKFGLGHFNLKPVAGNNYKVICIWEDGRTSVHELPRILEEGFAIQLKEEASELKLNVSSRGVAENARVYLLVQSRQQLKSASMKILENGATSFSVKKDQLVEGISQFTLFN